MYYHIILNFHWLVEYTGIELVPKKSEIEFI